MKTKIISNLRSVMNDRQVLGFLAVIIGLSILYILYVILSLRPTDVQVATHYSAFGDTHYYRNKWYYMLTFVGFGIIFASLHTAVILKLIKEDFRQLAIAFAWFSLIILAIAFIFTHSVLNIAFLT